MEAYEAYSRVQNTHGDLAGRHPLRGIPIGKRSFNASSPNQEIEGVVVVAAADVAVAAAATAQRSKLDAAGAPLPPLAPHEGRVRVAGPRPKNQSGVHINLLYRVLHDTHEELQATHEHMMYTNAYLIHHLCKCCKNQQMKVEKLEKQSQEEREVDQRYKEQMTKDYLEEVQQVQ
jgi:hypothetical protein